MRQIGSYELEDRPIGAGSFSIVYRARMISQQGGQETTSRFAAVKDIDLARHSSKKVVASLEQEIDVLKACAGCKHIVELLDFVKVRSDIWLDRFLG